MSYSKAFHHPLDQVDMTYHTRDASPGLSSRTSMTVTAIIQAAQRMVETMRLQRKAFRIANELEMLDDHILLDIGLRRWEITDAAKYLARIPGTDVWTFRRQA